MTFSEFHNALRILNSIDADEFRGAIRECEDGASLTLDGAFQRFVEHPVRFFLRADDQSAESLWRIIERRQPKRREPVPAGIDPAFRAHCEASGDHRAYVEEVERLRKTEG